MSEVKLVEGGVRRIIIKKLASVLNLNKSCIISTFLTLIFKRVLVCFAIGQLEVLRVIDKTLLLDQVVIESEKTLHTYFISIVTRTIGVKVKALVFHTLENLLIEIEVFLAVLTS